MTQQLADTLDALRKAHWTHRTPEENTLVQHRSALALRDALNALES